MRNILYVFIIEFFFFYKCVRLHSECKSILLSDYIRKIILDKFIHRNCVMKIFVYSFWESYHFIYLTKTILILCYLYR